MSRALELTHEESLERTRRVVPSQTLSISVPQLQTVLLFPILIHKVVRFSSIPVFISYRFTIGHPEKFSLLSLVGPTGPEMFLSHPEAGDVVLQVLLLLCRVDAGEVHPVVSAVLLRLVPVSLEKYSNIILLASQFL